MASTSIPKSALDGKALEYIQRVADTGQEIVITDNGRPVVKVTAIPARTSADELFADVRGRVVYHDDIFAPTTDEWPGV